MAVVVAMDHRVGGTGYEGKWGGGGVVSHVAAVGWIQDGKDVKKRRDGEGRDQGFGPDNPSGQKKLGFINIGEE